MEVSITKINEPWANLKASVYGLQNARARYEQDSKVLTMRFSADCDPEVVEQVVSQKQAERIFARKTAEYAKLAEWG